MRHGAPLKVLILGGYGTFGGRLARLLEGRAGITLLIGGRSIKQARSFCDSLSPSAQKYAVYFDRDGDVFAQVGSIAPGMIVDASGPFQCYGSDPYRVIRACLAHGIDYLDLADGAQFVKGVAQFDPEARRLGIFILSGVSSFPVLSAAVVRRLARGLARVETITGGIAPSPYAGVGVNVIRAIASYSGKRLALVRGGRAGYGIAMTESLRYTVSVPGLVPLRHIRFSLVDVPDLQVLPELWPGIESVWMGAGPVPEILHRMLNGLAWLVRLRLLPSLLALAPLIYFVSNRVRWGEHRGGMFVVITGKASNGAPVVRSWHLIAEGEDCPLIPSMACEAIIDRVLAASRPHPGARAATGELELDDYETLFAQRTIYTGTRTSDALGAAQPLYRRLLANAWDELPARLRDMHDVVNSQVASGRAEVRRGQHPLARLVASAVGFPAAGSDIPVEVSFNRQGSGELWTRRFNGRSFKSVQSEGTGRSAHLLCEKFGALRFELALVIEENKLSFVVRGWSLWGMRLPLFLAPGGNSYESVEGDRFVFSRGNPSSTDGTDRKLPRMATDRG